MQTIEKFYYDILSEQAAADPDREAVIMGNVRLTYSQFLHKIDCVAAFLLSKGMKRGDKVALWSTASPAWLYTYYGIIRAGGIALILNANLTVKDTKPLVEFADTVYMFFGNTHDLSGKSSNAALIAETFGLKKENCISIIDEDFEKVEMCTPDTTGWTVRDDAYIIYTSGTTAFPKAVITSQYAITNIVRQLAKEISSIRGDRMVLGVPMFHAYAIFVVWIYFSTGSTIIIPDALKAKVIADIVEREDASDLWSVAPIYQSIIDDKELTAKVAPRVRICSIAGSYTSPVQFMRFETALYKAKFINLYGMTETSATYTLTRPDDDVSVRYHTVGRPVDGVEAEIWDSNRGILPVGEIGEIITRGYHLKNGYYKLPPEEQAVDKDGWLHSGDLGVFDENRNLRIVGRIKDLIIKGGENIAPAEIEAQVMSHPSIAACRIFGYKDRDYGENLSACVTIAPGATFNEEELKKYMKEKTGSYKSPVYYFVFDEFPLNANGKIDQLKLNKDMLTRLHRIFIDKKLQKGVQIVSLSVRFIINNINSISEMFEEYAVTLGFSKERSQDVRSSVRELLAVFDNKIEADIGPIDIKLYCMKESMRITVTDPDLNTYPEREEQRKRSCEVISGLADSFSMKRLETGQYQSTADFTYDKDFNAIDFLMQNETIE